MGPRLILAVILAFSVFSMVSGANAQGVKFIGVGSTAAFNSFAVASFSDQCSARVGSDCHHWSERGAFYGVGDGSSPIAFAVDNRGAGAGDRWTRGETSGWSGITRHHQQPSGLISLSIRGLQT